MNKHYDEFLDWCADQPLVMAWLIVMTASGVVIFITLGIHFLSTEQYNAFIACNVIPFLVLLLLLPTPNSEP